ncbi:MAG: hypothetical protein ACODAA_09635, partial [Gemmatimonadota bacterium]
PSARSRDLARRVIELEAGHAAGGEARAEAAQRALARFHEHMRELVGAAGFDALAGRAIGRARSKHPALRDVDVSPDPATALDQLREALRDRGAEEVPGALECVLAHTIELLFRFLGARLTLRVVHHVWPDSEGPGETERSTESP